MVVRRTNKMITLTIPEMDYIDKHFKGKFSKFVSKAIVDHMSDLKHAQDLSSKRLVSMCLARLYYDEASYEEAKETEAFKLLTRLQQIL